MNLKDKVALIVGAGGGIGAATARLLAQRGAAVAVADLSIAAAQGVVDEINAANGRALALQVDIGEEKEIAAAVARTIEAFGRIDVLHNNAALTGGNYFNRDYAITEMEPEVWDQILRINLRGPMLCCKHVLPHMIKQRGGSIITSGSGRGIRGELDRPTYAASKAALVSLTQNIATQYGKDGVRANILAIGIVLSDAARLSLSAQQQDLFLQHHLTPQLGRPTDIATTVAFLASDESAFITGAVIPVDGGWLAHGPAYADVRRMRSAAPAR